MNMNHQSLSERRSVVEEDWLEKSKASGPVNAASQREEIEL